MKKIIFKDKFAFLYLNQNFYEEKAIIETLKVYKEFFDSSSTKLGKYFIIKIKKINNDFSLEELTKEFLNYLLSIEYQIKGNEDKDNKLK